MDLPNLEALISEKYISVKKHPSEELFIYNYTHVCQYDKIWNDTTMACRGLILNQHGDVIARPFKKFFNFEEHETLPSGDFKVFEKMDGSLGILYWIGDKPFIATRGSFTSDQAQWATQYCQSKNLDSFKEHKNITHLFEIIYPENRIVCNYGDKEALVYLASISNETGKDVDASQYIFETVKEYHGILDYTELLGQTRDNSEGYVLRWEDGFRVKIKHDEYKRLHKLITGVNERRIWEILSNGGTINDFLSSVPDEFYKFVSDIDRNLRSKFFSILNEAHKILYQLSAKNLPRKEAALYILANHKDVAAVIFSLMDNCKPDHIIWKMLYPPATKPFNVKSEDVA